MRLDVRRARPGAGAVDDLTRLDRRLRARDDGDDPATVDVHVDDCLLAAVVGDPHVADQQVDHACLPSGRAIRQQIS